MEFLFFLLSFFIIILFTFAIIYSIKRIPIVNNQKFINKKIEFVFQNINFVPDYFYYISDNFTYYNKNNYRKFVSIDTINQKNLFN